MIYFNARYYDPELGTFISPDTIVPDPTNLIDYNRYMYVRGNPLRYNDPSGHCVNSTTTNNSGNITYNNDECWRLANTIGAMWDDTDHWSTRFNNKDVFNTVASDAYNGTDFFQTQLDTFLASDEGTTWLAGIPDVVRPEQDFGDYTSFSFILPGNPKNSIGAYEGAIIMDDHWNFYYRSGPGIGSWGGALTRGDVLILQEGSYVDIDTLNLSPDQESILLQQRIPGLSSSLSGGTFIFTFGGATSPDGQTATIEGGFAFPASVVSGFYAPESETKPWFSWR